MNNHHKIIKGLIQELRNTRSMRDYFEKDNSIMELKLRQYPPTQAEQELEDLQERFRETVNFYNTSYLLTDKN